MGGFERQPAQTWVVHGESLAAHALRDAATTRLGWRNVSVPQRGQSVEV
jgi:metallo-beta-lactamase family protein